MGTWCGMQTGTAGRGHGGRAAWSRREGTLHACVRDGAQRAERQAITSPLCATSAHEAACRTGSADRLDDATGHHQKFCSSPKLRGDVGGSS